MAGSIAFCEFALLAYHRGHPEARDARYYKTRLRFYAFFLYMAGISLFTLSAYVIARFGQQLESGPIEVAFYVITGKLPTRR